MANEQVQIYLDLASEEMGKPSHTWTKSWHVSAQERLTYAFWTA